MMNATSQTNGRRAAVRALCLALVVGASAGCGGTGKKNVVAGTVTYKGNPVTGGNITFHPADGRGTPYPGTLKNDGTFSFTTVPTGKMRVTIETESLKRNAPGYHLPKDMKLPPGSNSKPPEIDTSALPSYVPIPRRYANPKTTTLECEITPGKKDLNFELTGPLP